MITKSIKSILAACLVGFATTVAFTACSDILETESTRQNIDPSITEKTDSAFYSFGILQALQELADQYVFQGELRGDLVKTTFYTDNNLRQLSDFSATTANKYDSAYVYYRVINNCNYYIAHCDTNQFNGSTNVVIDKYAATKAIRAWAYLQLGRNYERVPFFTEPLTQISQIDASYPELTLTEIVAQLAPDLEKYTGFKVPTLGYANGLVGMGSPNWESAAKQFMPSKCFVPVDVVLGDMYLETGNYDAAARHFINYFTNVTDQKTSNYLAGMASKNSSSGRFGAMQDDDLPDQGSFSSQSVWSQTRNPSPQWSTIFSRNNINDIITYIPMASTAQNGKTTNVPLTFGFDYYATPEEKQRSGAPYVDEIQLLPSDALNLLSDSTEFYYYAGHIPQTDLFDSVRIVNAGDMRLRSIIHQEMEEDSVKQWIDKYKYANIILYRVSTIWLRLAECFNRLGMPDAAFAILKDGVSEFMLSSYADGSYYMPYITDETRAKLQTTYPLLKQEFLSTLPTSGSYGIHCHGAGKAASDYPGLTGTGGSTYHTGTSPYQMDRIVGKKLAELAASGVAVGTTKQDTINAVEDIICDELALETAFEGNRWFDLKRMATHKNQDALYGANYGGQWLARKLAYKHPAKDLTNPQNWYLPFK